MKSMPRGGGKPLPPGMRFANALRDYITFPRYKAVSHFSCCEGHPIGSLRMLAGSTYCEYVPTRHRFLSERAIPISLHPGPCAMPRPASQMSLQMLARTTLVNRPMVWIGSSPKPRKRKRSSRPLLPAHLLFFPRSNVCKDYMAHNPAVVGSSPTLVSGEVAQSVEHGTSLRFPLLAKGS